MYHSGIHDVARPKSCLIEDWEQNQIIIDEAVRQWRWVFELAVVHAEHLLNIDFQYV